ncbi:MAG: alpha/beta hydrolase [Candidatus Dormibacteraeota bacterium]|nr:alpha/beta hydrolase [Candidatus Dormibacteraeota bacterium]
MPLATLEGASIFYEITGDGDPLILVHGSWADHHTWDLAVPTLAQHFKVITYDRRGHSQSTVPPGQGSVRDDVNDLAELIRFTCPGPTHVVGNSFGGSIVLRLAAFQPGLCRTVSVHEPPLMALLAGDKSVAPMMDEVQSRITAVVELLANGEDAAGAELFVETVALGPGMWRQLPEEVRQTFIHNARTFLDEAGDQEAFGIDLDSLRAYQGSAQLTQGGQSPPFFAAIIDALALTLTQSERLTYMGAGHIPHETHADEYSRGLTGFLTNRRAE